jgi:hypothetical protein
MNNIDADRDGTADDEAADAAIRQYKAGVSLVIVHLDSTDTAMHQYEPYSPGEKLRSGWPTSWWAG